MKKTIVLIFGSVMMLASFTASVQYERGDVDQDGRVTVADVTRLIDYLLYGTWGEEPVGPENPLDGHEWVDLGLPSGTLWATCNVGADSPEGYGDLFAWGETEPKSKYYWDTYKWCNGSDNTQTKYCTNPSAGTVDNKTELDPEDDAAYVNWGPSWRMPTKAQMVELKTNCTWVWLIQNGTYGIQLTGPNGKTLFLPAAGYYNFSHLEKLTQYGYYWSRSLAPDSKSAYSYLFYPWGWSDGNNERCYGYSVRPVLVSQD